MAWSDIGRPGVVGIVGAGLMGRGIAQITTQAGCEVRLFDAKAGAAAAARESIADTFAALVAKSRMTAAVADAALARIVLPDAMSGIQGADLVIEAIIERLDAKQALFAELEKIVAEDCVLASNTSSLSVTAIASACAHPERVAGLHFFSPVPLMKVVEVIDGVLTGPTVGTRLVTFADALGHRPVRARDTPGFLVNHAGRGYGTEALRILGEGIADSAAIDRILRTAAGFRMGPFELMDMTGLDVSHPVMESIYRQFYDEPRFRPSPLTAQHHAAGLLGRKSGRGFYDYRAGGPNAATSVPAPPAPQVAPASVRVWVGAADPAVRAGVGALVATSGAVVDEGATPGADALCVVLPTGIDATAAALDAGLDPARTVALDTTFDRSRHRTLMTTPVTTPERRDAAHAVFAADGVPVDVIRDSPGFVAPRVVAHIVNIACDIAQQRIAVPADIDLAVRLGLGYPQGPLAWGDALGPARVVRILDELAGFYGDPRYRASPWLRRRARLGVSLLVAER